MNEEKFDIRFFEDHFQQGQCRIKTGEGLVTIMETDDGYSVVTEPDFPNMVCDIKIYFADTLTLKQHGLFLKKGSTRIGVWTTFDRQGDVVDETDYEVGWNIHWDQLCKLIEAEGIDFGRLVSITRFDSNKRNLSGVRKPKHKIVNEKQVEEANEEPKEEKAEAELEQKLVWKVGCIVTSELLAYYVFDGLSGERLPLLFSAMKRSK